MNNSHINSLILIVCASAFSLILNISEKTNYFFFEEIILSVCSIFLLSVLIKLMQPKSEMCYNLQKLLAITLVSIPAVISSILCFATVADTFGVNGMFITALSMLALIVFSTIIEFLRNRIDYDRKLQSLIGITVVFGIFFIGSILQRTPLLFFVCINFLSAFACIATLLHFSYKCVKGEI